MRKYNKVTEKEVLLKYYNFQSNNNHYGLWCEYISAEDMADLLETSKYQIQKCYKNLREKGYLQVEKVVTYAEDYYNGLYDESVAMLFTRAYTFTEKGIKYVEKIRKED